MLPTDIWNLINIYNEPGIFVLHLRNIYWFNGKRFEFWTEFVYLPFTYENELYFCKCSQLCVYRNNKHVQIEFPKRWNHPLNLLKNTSYYHRQMVSDGNIYRATYHNTFEMFDGEHVSQLPQKQFPKQGLEMIAFNNNIYSFGSHRNERFDINSQQWIQLKSKYPSWNGLVHLLNDKLYLFDFHDARYWEYDLQHDEWQPKVE